MLNVSRIPYPRLKPESRDLRAEPRGTTARLGFPLRDLPDRHGCGAEARHGNLVYAIGIYNTTHSPAANTGLHLGGRYQHSQVILLKLYARSSSTDVTRRRRTLRQCDCGMGAVAPMPPANVRRRVYTFEAYRITGDAQLARLLAASCTDGGRASPGLRGGARERGGSHLGTVIL